MIYLPKNTSFNRSADLVNRQVQLLKRHNGLAYFAVLQTGGNVLARCSVEVFDKEFSLSEEAPTLPLTDAARFDTRVGSFVNYPEGFKSRSVF
jgi:hypothetical protein